MITCIIRITHSYLFNDPLEDTEILASWLRYDDGSGYLFNDPLEDTEMHSTANPNRSDRCYLFNDPLEDTEISRSIIHPHTLAVTCSTIR